MDLVERHTKAQALFRTDSTPEVEFNGTLAQDLGQVEPSLAGHTRSQDRVKLTHLEEQFNQALEAPAGKTGIGLPADERDRTEAISENGTNYKPGCGAVVIVAINSYTNTSNLSVMVGAGLLAKKAVERNLSVKPSWGKTSFTPGSRVVSNFLEISGPLSCLEALRFHVVGFGCTTCVGNSGPLPQRSSQDIQENNLVDAAVLLGNCSFEGRVRPDVRANYLATPPLVVAYALAETVDIDLITE